MHDRTTPTLKRSYKTPHRRLLQCSTPSAQAQTPGSRLRPNYLESSLPIGPVAEGLQRGLAAALWARKVSPFSRCTKNFCNRRIVLFLHKELCERNSEMTAKPPSSLCVSHLSVTRGTYSLRPILGSTGTRPSCVGSLQPFTQTFK